MIYTMNHFVVFDLLTLDDVALSLFCFFLPPCSREEGRARAGHGTAAMADLSGGKNPHVHSFSRTAHTSYIVLVEMLGFLPLVANARYNAFTAITKPPLFFFVFAATACTIHKFQLLAANECEGLFLVVVRGRPLLFYRSHTSQCSPCLPQEFKANFPRYFL